MLPLILLLLVGQELYYHERHNTATTSTSSTSLGIRCLLVCLFIHDHAHTYATGTTHLRRSHGTHFLPVCMGRFKNDDDDDGSHSII